MQYRKKALIFGASGKLGTALCNTVGNSFIIDEKCRRDVDITKKDQVERCIHESAPDAVINATAFVGIDACEQYPEKAFATNALFPKYLAELSIRKEFLLVHISTDAVFNGQKQDYYTEADCPHPINVYGMTKYAGDCFVQSIAQKYFIFRIPLLFGANPKNNQFVENMLRRIRQGTKELHISDDITTSPSHSNDIAQAINKIILSDTPHGLYHIANQGRASLCDLMRELVQKLDLQVAIHGCSHVKFPSKGIKNTYTPIRSAFLNSLRPWQQALTSYCNSIRQEVNDE